MPHGFEPLHFPARTPRVWVLTGHKAGDNSQVLALAEALGWPFEVKRFVYQPYELVTNLTLGTTVSGVKQDRSSPLTPPWPDLVISAGRRNEPVARWIKRAAAPHPVRLVHVGRPWTYLSRFDLIVTTPQYHLPDLPNILQNETPLHRVSAQRLRDDSAHWAPRFAPLPEPHIAVILGGSSGPYTFDTKAARRLARQASQLANARGGSLLITTSARTPSAAVETIAETVDAPHYLYRWRADAEENPYFAMLGLATDIIVTGDSMSMLTEACATQKPVHIFDLGEGRNAMRPPSTEPAFDLDPEGEETFNWRRPRIETCHVKAFFYRLITRLGPKRLGRDIRIIHQRLVSAGRATWLGDPFPRHRPVPPLECRERAAARVYEMMGDDFAPRPLILAEPSPARLATRQAENTPAAAE